MSDTYFELTLCTLRHLLCEKERLVATMNHDLAKYGEWQANYTEYSGELNDRIEFILKREGATLADLEASDE